MPKIKRKFDFLLYSFSDFGIIAPSLKNKELCFYERGRANYLAYPDMHFLLAADGKGMRGGGGGRDSLFVFLPKLFTENRKKKKKIAQDDENCTKKKKILRKKVQTR